MITRSRLDGLSFLLMGAVAFLSIGTAFERASPVSMLDFKPLYYGTRCLMNRCDPYNPIEVRRFYIAESGPSEPNKEFTGSIISLNTNIPTSLTFLTPFAALPWGPAHIVWGFLTAGLFVLASLLIWNLAATYSPAISGALLGMLLGGSVLLLEIGNAAGIVVSLCAISVWCFSRNQVVSIGAICLAIGLTLKPHDVGFVWLYFLLAGERFRKGALQAFLFAIVLSIPALFWVSHVAPGWEQELHSNLLIAQAHKGENDPGPARVDPRAHGAIPINLQTAISVIQDDPNFYQPVSLIICVPLFLLWIVVTLRSTPSPTKSWLALATIAALSMLPIYHRQHDSRLLLLTVPACAMLWAERGLRGWIAALVTATGIGVTGDLPAQILALRSHSFVSSVPGLFGKVLTIIFDRPAPIILLAMGIFYLWVYYTSQSKSGSCRESHPRVAH